MKLKILITSIVDLKKSQHNRPHQFVKYLSKKHEVTVLSINDGGKRKNIESAEKVTVTIDMLLVMLDYCLQHKRATLG